MRLACLLLLAGLSAHAAAPFVSDSLPERAKRRIGTARLRHGGLVRGLAFSRDGRRLASASHDATVSVWEVPSGRELYRLKGHDADVLAVSFSGDNELVASAGADGYVCLWAVLGPQAGQLRHRFLFRSATVEAMTLTLAFSPTSDVLAAGCDDGSVRLLDVRKRGDVTRLTHDDDVTCLAWSADGKRLACNGAQGAITIWDVEKGRSLHRLGKEKVNCLTFAPTGRDLLSWEAGGVVRLWDADAGKEVRQFTSGETSPTGPALTYQLAFAKDHKAFVGSLTGPVDVWDTATGKRLAQLTGHHGRVTAVALSPRGDMLATGGADHTIRLWHAGTGQEVSPQKDALAPIAAVALPERGSELAVLLATGELKVYDRQTGRAVADSPTRDVRACAFLPGGTDLALIDSNGLGRWWREKAHCEVLDREEPVPVGLALCPGDKYLVTLHRNGDLRTRDLAGKPLGDCRGSERNITPLVSPDGKDIVGYGQLATIPHWHQGHPRPPLSGHRGGTLAAAYSPDGKVLASGGRDNLLRVWDVQKRKEARTPNAHDAWVCAIAFSPDSRLMASATVRGDIHLWAASSGRLVGELSGHRGAVRGLAFADAGKTLISGGQDASVLVWDVAGITGAKPLPLRLSAARAEELWKDLRDPREPVAVLALQKLSRDPERVVPLVRDRIRPVDGIRITRLIGRLDDEEYPARTQAFNDLAGLGRFAEGPMRAALARKPNLEARRRLEELLRRCAAEGPTAEHQQALRSVGLLEMVGSAEAGKLLERLASGAAEAELTRDAQAAAQRLKKEKASLGR